MKRLESIRQSSDENNCKNITNLTDMTKDT